jgi:hypothetical protein
MNTLLLRPTDVLFFRDGRPMTGSLAGHTAAWPMPNVVSAALHAALHRAGLDQVHVHRRGRSGRILSEDRDQDGRKFGSLTSAGPFPVQQVPGEPARWFFPRPADAQQAGSPAVTLRPVRGLHGLEDPWLQSSLPNPLEYAVASTVAPDKDNQPEPWISREAFVAYLGQTGSIVGTGHYVRDGELADREHQIGIGIDPTTQSAGQGEAVGRIYSAHYLRLREGWRLGVLASAQDKEAKADLLPKVIQADRHIVIGGQQRICTAELLADGHAAGRSLPLPRGQREGFTTREGRKLVKWVLLSPAVWPAIKEDSASGITAHSGGWLPNWIEPATGSVLLKAGATTRQPDEPRQQWRERVRRLDAIDARLVAAVVPKPLVVTGWSLGDARRGDDGRAGAKSTHLAVPAGAVYYFEAGSDEAATALADALNWQGRTQATEIENHRSTLMGEKGFGLGVCGTWNFYENVAGRPGN